MDRQVDIEVAGAERGAVTLVQVVRGVADGTADPRVVTAVLRRICLESRNRPPELLLLRIKQLWTDYVGRPRLARDERDRRYFALIGEALVHYFGSGSSDGIARHPSFVHPPGCGEPETRAALS